MRLLPDYGGCAPRSQAFSGGKSNPSIAGLDNIVQGIPGVLAIVAAMAAVDRNEGGQGI
jgi:hypothetical protein